MLKKFKDLTEKEILRLRSPRKRKTAIYGSLRTRCGRVSLDAEMFEEMREEEVGHRDRLFAMFRQRSGNIFR